MSSSYSVVTVTHKAVNYGFTITFGIVSGDCLSGDEWERDAREGFIPAVPGLGPEAAYGRREAGRWG
jgi:hypothetical protein